MAVGRVKWFNDEKGWGFIKQDAGPDVFVHYSQIQGEGRRRLFEDELVEFEIKEGPEGLAGGQRPAAERRGRRPAEPARLVTRDTRPGPGWVAGRGSFRSRRDVAHQTCFGTLSTWNVPSAGEYTWASTRGRQPVDPPRRR